MRCDVPLILYHNFPYVFSGCGFCFFLFREGLVYGKHQNCWSLNLCCFLNEIQTSTMRISSIFVLPHKEKLDLVLVLQRKGFFFSCGLVRTHELPSEDKMKRRFYGTLHILSFNKILFTSWVYVADGIFVKTFDIVWI